MEIVIGLFMLNKKISEDTEGNAYCQADDVDRGVALNFIKFLQATLI